MKPRYKEPAPHEIFGRQFLIKDQHDQVVVNDEGEMLVGAVLDDQSITKRNLGKVAYSVEVSAGIEQLLHPAIGAAVEQTGVFWRNPYQRVAVSIDPIMRVVYAEDPRAAGNHVRNLHKGINGKDHRGRGFNALDPEAFFWAHETFRSGVEKTADHYSLQSLTPDDKEQLQLESTTWYSYYSMPMGIVPADRQANVAYREHTINNVLEMNPSAERAIDMAVRRELPRPQNVPKIVWSLARLATMPAMEVASLVTLGEIDPAIRKKFNIPFSANEQKHLDELRLITRTLLDPLPDQLRYTPVANRSFRREAANKRSA